MLRFFTPLAFIILLYLPVFGLDCPNDHYFVTGHFRRAYYKANGTFVKASNVVDYCKPYSEGYGFAKDRLKNGVPPNWPHKNEQTANWSVEEREKLYEAFNEISPLLWRKNIKGIYRLKRSKDFPNPATSANEIIVLYDNLFANPNKDVPLVRILAHELAHQLYLDLSGEEKTDYHFVTNWWVDQKTKEGKTAIISRASGFVQEDGKVSPSEDFANNIEYFMFNPAELKSRTPHAYRWINEKYGDRLKIKGGK